MTKIPSAKTLARIETFKKNHSGLTPTEWEALEARGLGLSRYQYRKNRAALNRFQGAGQVGPLPERQARVASRLTVAQMDAANREWSTTRGAALLDRLAPATMGGEFEAWKGPNDRRNRQALAISANSYNETLAKENPRYVVSFYNAIVNHKYGYWSNHSGTSEDVTPVFSGSRVQAAPDNFFREYMKDWLSVITGNTEADMEAWYDHRYSMALLDR